MQIMRVISFVILAFFINMNLMVKGMEIQQYILTDKIFMCPHENDKNEYFQLCKDGTRIKVGQEIFSQISHGYYCAKIIMDKERDDKNILSQSLNELMFNVIGKDIFIQPLSEVTPDCIHFVKGSSSQEFPLLPITLTKKQIKEIKQKTKKITLVKDKKRIAIKDLSGMHIIVFDNLNNIYKIIEVHIV